MSDDRIAAIAARQHGAFSARQAADVGLSEKAVRGRVASGRWVKPHRAVYTIAGSPATPEQRTIAAVLSLGPRAVAASVTAAFLHGLSERPSDLVYVAMPDGQHRRKRKGLVIVEARLTKTDIQTRAGIRCTAPNRTIIDLAGAVPKSRLEAALDDAIQLGLTTVPKLRRHIRERNLQHRPGARNLRELLDDRTLGAPQKELERMFIRKLRAAGLPAPIRQHPCGEHFIDFAYADRMIAIELDGLRAHFSADAFKRDRRRQNAIVLAGYTILRFTWEDVRDGWPAVEATIRRAIDSS